VPQRFAKVLFARLKSRTSRAPYPISKLGFFGFFRPRKIPALYSFCGLTRHIRIKYSVLAKRSRETRAISGDFARSPLLHFFGSAARHNFTRLAGRAP